MFGEVGLGAATRIFEGEDRLGFTWRWLLDRAAEVDPRTEQHYACWQWHRILLEADQQRNREPAAGGIAREDDRVRVGAVVEHPLVGTPGVIEGGRERVLGRQPVFRHDDADVGGDRRGSGQMPV